MWGRFGSRFATFLGEHLKLYNVMKNSGLCLITLFGGALIGAAVAMLVTPKTGQEMRDSIRDFVNKEMERARCKCNEAGHNHDVTPVQ